MKHIAAVTLIALLGMGSASADINSEERQWVGGQSLDVNTLPATAAGPSMTKDEYQFESPEFN